jgi:hypothetical protein
LLQSAWVNLSNGTDEDRDKDKDKDRDKDNDKDRDGDEEQERTKNDVKDGARTKLKMSIEFKQTFMIAGVKVDEIITGHIA